MPSPFVIVVMGVSGCGKTTVAQQLSQDLNLTFIEADKLHPKANKDKMASGKETGIFSPSFIHEKCF